MTQQQISYLAQLHEGQWFGFNGEQTYENLWVKDGYNKPTLKEIEDGVPQLEIEQWRNSFKVPTYKLEIELEERGLMETVQTIIDQSPKPVRIGWNKSPTVRRMSPTVLGLASHPDIALTAEQLDDIFKSAEQREL